MIEQDDSDLAIKYGRCACGQILILVAERDRGKCIDCWFREKKD
jgi:hypothetical protein